MPRILYYAPNQISEPVILDDPVSMIPLLILFTAAALAGVVVLMVSSKKAPEGYQSETGFHYGPKETIDSGSSTGHTVSGPIASGSRDRVAARSNQANSGSSGRVFTRSAS